MSVDEIGRDMAFLPQEPGGPEENDPQEGIFGGGDDPYRCLCKQETHADGVADSSCDQHEYHSSKKSHEVDEPVKKSPESLHEIS